MTASEFFTKYNGRGIDLLKMACVGSVYSLMFSSGNYDKVFNSIVGLIKVNMVDNFFGFKIPTNRFFNYQSMFGVMVPSSLRMIRSIFKYMTAPIYYSTTFPMIVILPNHKFSLTGIRTKSSRLISPILKVFATVLTIHKLFPRKVIAFPTAEGGLVGWGSLKSNLTFRTFEKHINILRYSMRGVKEVII